jgi:hypothetical protein
MKPLRKLFAQCGTHCVDGPGSDGVVQMFPSSHVGQRRYRVDLLVDPLNDMSFLDTSGSAECCGDKHTMKPAP